MARPGISITSDNLGPAVNLAAWICLVVMSLAVLAKVISKLIRVGKGVNLSLLQADDWFLTAAMITTIGHAIAISQQVPGGIGRHIETLDSLEIKGYEKAQYASQLLYIWALCLTKLSTLCFVMTLTYSSAHRRSIWATAMLVTMWTLASIFIIAFQCPSPATWATFSDQCISQRSMWDGIETLNILTEATLALLPIYILWALHLAWIKKGLVMAAFALRLLDVPLFALRTVYIEQALQSTDRTYNEFKSTVTTEVALNVSIILACLPFLKLLLDNLQSGWSTSNVQTGAGFRNTFWTSDTSAGFPRVSTPAELSRGRSGGQSPKSDIGLVQLSARENTGDWRDINRERFNETAVA